MSEIELLYENAHIEKVINHECTYDYGITCPNDNDTCGNCGYYKEKEPDYPPFTAEKQLEIVKLILFSTWWMNLKRLQFSEKFDERLAELVNDIWQDLTEQDRTEIAEILRG